MLSDELRSAEDFLAKMISGEVEATRRNLYNLSVLVRCCRETARHMERNAQIAQVATEAHFVDGKVVRLPIAGRDVGRAVGFGGPEKGGAA